jgi:MFS family permease
MPPSRFGFMLRALSHRNYRLFFAGQGTSLVGTWVTRVATSWLVYRLTGSAAVLGLVGFAGQIPTFLLAPLAGVWVDRWSRYRVLLVTQVLSMLQSLALAWLALAGTIDVTSILILSAFQGIINAFDTPARQAFVVDMVDDRADLPNAIALNSSMVNGARLIGPSVAGVLIAVAGEGLVLPARRPVIRGRPGLAPDDAAAAPGSATPGKRVLLELGEGFRYAFGFAPIRAVLLLPHAHQPDGDAVHGADAAHGRGSAARRAAHARFPDGAVGVGALGGAAYLASRRSVLGLGRLIPAASIVFGCGLIAFSLSRTIALSLVLLVVTGVGFMVQLASSNTIVQTIVREEMRGRVMAFYTMAFIGTAPFGSLLAGGLAARVGAPSTILFGGAACILGGLLFARQLPRLRALVVPIYVERGILPEIAAGLSDAAVLGEGSER